MLEQIMCENFTVFKELNVKFSPKLNIFVGENGSGKTHLLKLAYSIISAPIKEPPENNESFKEQYDFALFLELCRVFSTKDLCDMISWGAKNEEDIEKIKIDAYFSDEKHLTSELFCNMKTKQVTGSGIIKNERIESNNPVFLGTSEILSSYPWLPQLCNKYKLIKICSAEMDTCNSIGLPQKNEIELSMTKITQSIQAKIGGIVNINGPEAQFVSTFKNSRTINTPLMSEGHKKFATLALLISSGVIAPGAQLFWDEPEANLNPKLIKEIAKIIFDLSEIGVQIFIGTHSLFLIKEIDLLHKEKVKISPFDLRIFEFDKKDISATVIQRNSLSEMENFSALEEELNQASRILRS